MYDRTGYFWNQLYKQSLSRTWLFWKVSEHTYRVLFFQFFKGRVGWEEAWIFIHVLIMNANRLIGVWQDRLYFKSALQTDNYPCSNLTSLESLRATTNRVIYFFTLLLLKGSGWEETWLYTLKMILTSMLNKQLFIYDNN